MNIRSDAACASVLRRAVLLAIALFYTSACFGQGFGTIVGTVTDPSGAVIAGAKVTVVDPASGTAREETTNDQGYFVVPTLKPATYDVTISAAGFGPSTQKGITLLANQNATVNTTLTLGQAAETISVGAEAPQVNTTSSTLSDVVEQRRVVDLPLNGRNAASLLLVVAGAIPAPRRTM
jgi:Carboxypeptidase regulatory-like domain